MTQPQPDDPQRDPVIFGGDPFAHERPPIEDDQPSYRPRPRWPFAAAIVVLVAIMVVAVGLWVF
jgi:hypothetical protein